MNRSDLKAGDQAMLVWGCCPEFRGYIGWVATVAAIHSRGCVCKFCGQKTTGSIPIAEFSDARGQGYIPVAWLRKLPPADEPAAETTLREVTA